MRLGAVFNAGDSKKATICEVGIASILRNLLWYIGIDSIYSIRYRAVAKAVYNSGKFRHQA